MSVVEKSKRKVTAGQTISLLKKQGIEVNEKEAEEILDFLYFLGELTVKRILKGELDEVADF